MKIILAVTAILLSAPTLGAQASPSSAILGTWRGTSICVKAPWNASCNDEQVIYYISRTAPDTSRFVWDAWKIVGRDTVSMGDLPMTYDATANRWHADFSNQRTTIRFTLEVNGSSMTGVLDDQLQKRKVRDIRATHISAETRRK